MAIFFQLIFNRLVFLNGRVPDLSFCPGCKLVISLLSVNLFPRSIGSSCTSGGVGRCLCDLRVSLAAIRVTRPVSVSATSTLRDVCINHSTQNDILFQDPDTFGSDPRRNICL